MQHTSAIDSHYVDAENYDAFNENRSKTMNQLIENLLKENKAYSILELTCRTKGWGSLTSIGFIQNGLSR